MPRRAHRRCKEQGPTCNGVSHPGFDVCARCLHDVVRPRMREEKEAVRKRRAERLSKENRALISAVDLAEPQLRETWQAHGEAAPAPMSLVRAIAHVRIENELKSLAKGAEQSGLPPDEALSSAVSELILKKDMERYTDVPIEIDGFPPKPPEPTPAKETLSPVFTRYVHKGSVDSNDPLTADQVTEICDAYAAGMVVMEICDAYNVVTTTLYSIIREAGIPLRSHIARPLPPPIAGPLRPLRRPLPPQRRVPPMPVTSSPSESHVPSAPPSVNGPSAGLPEWVVTYTVTKTDTVTVAAKDFNAAAAAVEARGIEVISVARKLP